jgi:hypothetical protein
MSANFSVGGPRGLVVSLGQSDPGGDVVDNMKKTLFSMGWLLVGGMAWTVASACGLAPEGHGSHEAEPSEPSAEIAFVPAVVVDGLERLNERSHGTVFVEEVLLHAGTVKIRDTRGDDHDLGGSDRCLLRYSPAAGEAGLSRLWTPAAEYEALLLEATPLFASPDAIRRESRVRGFDVSELADASVLVRGVVVVGEAGAGEGGLSSLAAPGLGCANGNGLACRGTVPDTAPARGNTPRPVGSGSTEGMAREDDGTVPDTAPARGEVTHGKTGWDDGQGPGDLLGGRTLVPFVLTTSSRFQLSGALDPRVSRQGGVVALHLDADRLFTDARLRQLVSAAVNVGGVVRASVPLGDVSASFRVQASQTSPLAGPKPR